MGFFISTTFSQILYLYMNSYIYNNIWRKSVKSNDDIFEGKSFQDLTEDIYKNTTDRKKQIDLLVSEIHGFITTIDDVILVAPIIKEYMEVAVKNDEHLVKLAGVLQRIISKSQGDSDETMLLSDSEKEELMGTLQDVVNDLQKESDKIDGIKEKTIRDTDN